MLKNTTIKDFIGLRSADITFGAFNVFYGLNGAGKSSIADALAFALTGEVVRGETVANVIRQGAKSAYVDVVLSATGTGIGREATKTGRKVHIDGVPLAEKDALPAIRKELPASDAAIRSALRAGAILDLKPAQLQQLLVELTGGAAFDATLLADVAEALARRSLKAPTTIAGLDVLATDAVAARKDAKRTATTEQANLDAIPVPSPRAADGVTVEHMRSKLTQLRARRDAAIRATAGHDGARDERRREVEAQLREIGDAAVPPAANASEAIRALDAAQVAVVRADEAVKRLSAEILGLERLAADPIPAAPALADARAAVDAAVKARAGLVAAVDAKVAEGKALREQVDGLRQGVGSTCSHCTQPIGPAVVEALDARLATMRTEREALVSSLREAEAAETAARQDVLKAERATAIRDAAAKLADLQAKKPAAEQTLSAAIAAEQGARAARDAAVAAQRAHDDRAAALQKATALRRELAALETPAPTSAENVAELDVAIDEAARIEASIPVVEKRARIAKWVADAQAAVEDCDAIEAAAKAAKVELIARSVGPFTKAANDALSVMWPGVAIVVTESLGIEVRRSSSSLSVGQLSDGERTRVLYALQLAAVRLAKLPLLILDRAELIDAAGRMGVKRLAGACAAEGIQVVMLTCAEAPASLPASVTGFVVEDGRVTRIPAVEKVAA
jgi:hypothetical protein